MNRYLNFWILSVNYYQQCRFYHLSHLSRRNRLNLKRCIFRPNWNHIYYFPLQRNWSRQYCQQDTKILWKHKALQKYVEDLSGEYQKLDGLLHHISVSEGDRRTMSKRHAELAQFTAIYKEIQESEKAIEELESMCKSLDKQDEKQLLELALEEREVINQKINRLCRELFQSLVPKDRDDKNDIILEVTSGRTTGGGLHHAAARISGDSVYKYLKYEGGIHRVQRIPEVGLSSRMQRIHTGTMSVIVLPQPDEVDIKVEPKDLRIDTFRSKGAGGQHVNTTDSAVRIVHLPTGLVVECQQERSQMQNKDIALRVLRAKLYQQTVEREQSKRQSVRKLQVGTRAQSERIRTYNFTQDRVTDHRISYEARDIKEFLCGGRPLDMLIQRLLVSANEEALVEILDNHFKSFEERK
uniref:Mitochondrial translation release factor 1 n=1 Tax=Sarcophilus harrisii TaxID=9305 RepID=G3X111_SARHA